MSLLAYVFCESPSMKEFKISHTHTIKCHHKVPFSFKTGSLKRHLLTQTSNIRLSYDNMQKFLPTSVQTTSLIYDEIFHTLFLFLLEINSEITTERT